MELEHALVPEDISDGGAGLIIGRGVGQFIVRAKGFAVVAGANAAGEIELLADDIVPNAPNGIDIGLIPRQRRHISHAGVHVDRPYRMTQRFILLNHR